MFLYTVRPDSRFTAKKFTRIQSIGQEKTCQFPCSGREDVEMLWKPEACLILEYKDNVIFDTEFIQKDDNEDNIAQIS